MIVPSLADHLQRHGKCHNRCDAGGGEMGQFAETTQAFDESRDAQADPNGKRVERTGIGVVTFARFARGLVQIEDNGQTGHEEEEEDNPELLDAFLAAVGLPEHAEESEQQGQAVEDVVSLVFAQIGGEFRLIAVEGIVDERNTGDPLAVFEFAVALNVVLTAGKVPHEVAPVHEVHLVGEEEAEVVPLRGHFAGEIVGLTVILAVHFHRFGVNTAQPLLVKTGMGAREHTGEEHFLRRGVDGLAAHLDDVVLVGLVGIFLLVTLHTFFLAVTHSLRGKGLTIEKGFLSVLLAVQISAEREDVFGRVLIHRRVLCRTQHDECVGRIADHEHQHAEQRGVERALAHHILAVFLPLQEEPKRAEHNGTEQQGRDVAFAVERNAQHAHTGEIKRHGAHPIALERRPQGGADYADQHEDVDDHTTVERQSQHIDEEKLEPSAHFHDAGHDTIEYGGHQHNAEAECHQRTFEVGIGGFLIIIDQNDGRQAQQIEQVHTDGQTGEVENQHNPAIGVRRVGIVFPFQNEPEHQSREHRRIGVDFALDCGEPEGVAPRVGQSTGHTAGQNGQRLAEGFDHAVGAKQLTRQMRDAPEQEQDAECREQGAHYIDPVGHLLGTRGKERKELAREHKEGCSGRVTHFKPIGRSDELRTIPE